jgi:hypothetical protein
VVHAFRILRPFLAKWGALPDDYEALYQQALEEMQQPAFSATAELLTAWTAQETTPRSRSKARQA